nr:hypothetical protein CFP56_28869 [Quercus suber]
MKTMAFDASKAAIMATWKALWGHEDKVFDEDNSSVRESSNDRPMRKKEAIKSREKNVQSIHSVEENYLHSCFAHTRKFCRLYSLLLVEAIGLAQ